MKNIKNTIYILLDFWPNLTILKQNLHIIEKVEEYSKNKNKAFIYGGEEADNKGVEYGSYFGGGR